MCGIAGIANFNHHPIPSELLKTLGKVLAHRGPDDEGFLSFNPSSKNLTLDKNPANLSQAPIAFVHRRLAIQDLNPSAAQPMLSFDRQYAIVFNGEIYNFIELREELKKIGYFFNTACDTEVLLAAYHYFGKQVFQKLIGMYAFAILDITKNEIILARDNFGMKPLYFYHSSHYFGFASEIKALLNMPFVSKGLNPQALYEYLTLGHCDFTDKTFYLDIQPLPASHYITLNLTDNTLSEPVRFWDVNFEDTLDISKKEAASELQQLFQESILQHQRSSVPIGAALSGGIDSSAIVCSILNNSSQYNQHSPLPTFSYIASNPKVSEAKWIELLTKELALVNHPVYLNKLDWEAQLNHILQSQDQPFGSPSIIAQYFVYQKAKANGINVLLNGQGSDELFAGYRYYLKDKFYTILNQQNPLSAITFLFKALFNNTLFSIPDTKMALNYLIKYKKAQAFNYNFINAPWFLERNVNINAENPYVGKHPLRYHLHQMVTREGLISLLRYDDHNAMAHGVETRLPFLTPKIAEFALRLPEDYLISPNGTQKSIVREAFQTIVPQPILKRKDKIGFVVNENYTISNHSIPQLSKSSIAPFLTKNFASTPMDFKILTSKPLWRLWCAQQFYQQINTTEPFKTMSMAV